MNQIINHETLSEVTNCKKLDDLEKVEVVVHSSQRAITVQMINLIIDIIFF
jgi:hypothetical protein